MSQQSRIKTSTPNPSISHASAATPPDAVVLAELFRRILLVDTAPQNKNHHLLAAASLAQTWHSEIILLDSVPRDSVLRKQRIEQGCRLFPSLHAVTIIAAESGTPPTAVVETALREWQPTLVILPQEHPLPKNAPWFGTITQRLIRRAPLALLVIPEFSKISTGSLVALLAETDSSRRAISFAAALSMASQSKLHVIRALPDLIPMITLDAPVWRPTAMPITPAKHDKYPAALPFLARGSEPDLQTENCRRDTLALLRSLGVTLPPADLRVAAGMPSAITLHEAHRTQAEMIVVGAESHSLHSNPSCPGSAEIIAGSADIPTLIIP